MKADNLDLSDQCREVSGLTPEGLGKAEPLDRVLQQVRCCFFGKGALQGEACERDLMDLKKETDCNFVFHFEITSKFSCFFLS